MAVDPERLEMARLRAFYTVGELATRAGVSRRTLWAARKGRPVGVRIIRKLAKVLNLRPPDLVGPAFKELLGGTEGACSDVACVGEGVAWCNRARIEHDEADII